MCPSKYISDLCRAHFLSTGYSMIILLRLKIIYYGQNYYEYLTLEELNVYRIVFFLLRLIQRL
jgi:hypothetical protein